jgi:spermidine/putrescine-binding protein
LIRPLPVLLIFVLSCAIFCLGGCSEQPIQSPAPIAASQRTLTFYNWEDYIDAEAVAGFERETGIKVTLIEFKDDEEIIAAMQSGAFDGDLVVVSESLAREMVGAKLLAPIDYARVPNARHIDPELMGSPVRPHAVPYLMGTTGLIYSASSFPEGVRSWAALWDERARGRIGMLNNPFEVAAVASKLLGYGVNPTPGQMPSIRERLLEQKPLLAGYFGPIDAVDKAVSGELVIAHAYSGDAMIGLRENPGLRYVVPEEGCVSWMDDFVVPKNARNVEEAHLFIDYIHRPEVIGRISSALWYATPNLASRAFVDRQVLRSSAVYPPANVLRRCEFFQDMGEGESVRRRLELWAELMSN